ncbi:MAG: uroporphyrinogen-III C-methyltransferase [Acidimicrobiales bacterium]
MEAERPRHGGLAGGESRGGATGSPGTVYLVGAGPGAPGMVTLRAREVLQMADVVLYDRLVSSGVIAMARAGAELISVGKPSTVAGAGRQKTINELLVRLGSEGRTVVRLKGGDPFVFGRGGEEAAALASAGVAFEVVPGISAALGVPAAAGIPLTHRGLASSFTVITAKSAGEPAGGAPRLPDADLAAAALSGGTVVALMAAASAPELARRMIAAGRSPSTPVAVISQGTTPRQRTTRGVLGELASAGASVVEAPATVVVGEVAALDLSWPQHRPLSGCRVVVTRAAHQASGLSRALEAAGAEAIELPTIAIAGAADGGAALKAVAAEVASYDWVVFTSANAVGAFMGLLRDARSFGRALVAAIGPATAEALRLRGVEADLVPPSYVAESLVEAFPPAPPGGGAVLLPRAARARDALPEGLTAMGWQVRAVEAYRTVPARPAPEVVEAARTAEVIAFTSPSTVHGYLEVTNGVLPEAMVACIGPVTARAARKAGMAVAVVATEHTTAGIVAALSEHLAAGHGPPGPGGRA